MDINDDLTLFKYTSFSIAESIVSGQHLKFENPNRFNDPFDCSIDRLHFSMQNAGPEVADDIEKLKNMFGDEILEIPNSIYENAYRKIKEQLIAQSAISCFSLTNDMPLMWAHYADNHKGICLVFRLKLNNSPFPLFNEDKITQGAVSYPESNESVNYLEDKSEGVKQIFLTKSKHWSYEQEFRFVMLNTEPGLYRFNDSFLTGVIFGVRTTKVMRESFKHLCLRSGFSNLSFATTKVDKLELKVVPGID